MRRWTFVLIVAALIMGCATSKALTPVERLDELKPSISTQVEVERILGPPNGSGGAAFPADARPPSDRYKVWYYLDYQKKTTKVPPPSIFMGRRPVEIYHVLPRMLLVFFDKDVFVGFMWFDLIGAVPQP